MEANEYRTERDSLGEKEVPRHAYYGVQTERALENFPITHLRLSSHVIQALGVVKKSAAQANRDVGLLNDEKARAIIRASEEVIAGEFDEQFIVDPIQGGAGTSLNMNANEVIANRALEILGEQKGAYHLVSPMSDVNMSQSTNDVIPTVNRLAIIKMSALLLDEIDQLKQSFVRLSKQFHETIKIGRTHLQDAIPIRLGQEFSAYSEVLHRDFERIGQSLESFYEINMGGTAVGTGLNANLEYIEKVAEYLRENSSLPFATANHLIDATQHTDAYTSLSAMLNICMTNISKIANDIRLMASGPKAGLSEIHLPPRQPGSSIMPGKVNPVMPEVVNQVAFRVSGNNHTVHLSSEAGQFELNVMEPVLTHHLMDSIQVMSNVFRVFRLYCVDGITANESELAKKLEQSLGVVTAINPHIGYEKASEVAKEAYATNRSVREVCIEKGFLTAEEIDQILEPKGMTSPGISAHELIVKRSDKK
ncbi:MAG TPA: aspartate ammonia-lyase [Bacillota bacterium]|nr:aspartate ammonia-lyase [Bacillota bacterium]